MESINKVFKKALSLLLVAVMLVVAMPMNSFAVDDSSDVVPDGYTGISTIEELYSVRYALNESSFF